MISFQVPKWDTNFCHTSAWIMQIHSWNVTGLQWNAQLFLRKMGVSYFCYTYAVKTMIICTCFWLAAKSVQSDTIYEKLIGSKLILETFRDFWELQCSAVMQFRKEKLQYDSAVQYCSPMLSSSAAMQCCTAMWHCNVAFAGGSPVTHLQTLAWNAMQSRASEQSSKRASKQPYSCNAMLQCNAAWQCHNAMLHCRWVTGDPPPNIGLHCNPTQCNATKRQSSAMQCNEMLQGNAGIYWCNAPLAMFQVHIESFDSSLIGLSRWSHIYIYI